MRVAVLPGDVMLAMPPCTGGVALALTTIETACSAIKQAHLGAVPTLAAEWAF